MCFSHPKGCKGDQLDFLWAWVDFSGLEFCFSSSFREELHRSIRVFTSLPKIQRGMLAWVCLDPLLYPSLSSHPSPYSWSYLWYHCSPHIQSPSTSRVHPMTLVGVGTYNACCSEAIPASSSVDQTPSLPYIQLRARTFASPALQLGLLSPFFFLGESKGDELPGTELAFGSCFLPICIYAICKYAIYMCQQMDLCHLF